MKLDTENIVLLNGRGNCFTVWRSCDNHAFVSGAQMKTVDEVEETLVGDSLKEG
jgi:hypothetical protein